ncbi:MAG: DMT family transporter [Candidatus Dormibacteria bacterium]
MVAFVIAWLWAGLGVNRISLAAALATSLGIATFVVVADPRLGSSQAGRGSWVLIMAGLAVVLGVGAVVSSPLAPKGRAAVLALVAGIALGCSDALTKQTLGSFSQHGMGALADWPVYLLVLVGAVAFLAQQSAYHAGPLASSLPVLSVTEPLVGVLLGVGIFEESPRAHGMLPLMALALALLAMGWGMRQLGRQPLAGSAGETIRPSADAIET